MDSRGKKNMQLITIKKKFQNGHQSAFSRQPRCIYANAFQCLAAAGKSSAVPQSTNIRGELVLCVLATHDCATCYLVRSRGPCHLGILLDRSHVPQLSTRRHVPNLRKLRWHISQLKARPLKTNCPWIFLVLLAAAWCQKIFAWVPQVFTVIRFLVAIFRTIIYIFFYTECFSHLLSYSQFFRWIGSSE